MGAVGNIIASHPLSTTSQVCRLPSNSVVLTPRMVRHASAELR